MYLLVLLFAGVLLHWAEPINVDYQHATIVKYPYNTSAHFGHSVLVKANQYQNIFVIGAPDASLPAQHEGVNNTGDVFWCKSNHCERLKLEKHYGSFAQTSELYTNDMHLGFTLVNRPKHAKQYLTCAHSRTAKYQFGGDQLIHPNGACYLFSDVTHHATILPLENTKDQFHQSGVYYFSHAMSGFSASFSKDGSRLFLGAPGLDDWRGALVEIEMQSGSKVWREKYHVLNPDKSNRDVYLGYSIAVGRFFESGEHVALSSPRQHTNGTVWFFTLTNSVPTVQAHHKLTGTQKFEYYGSCLLSVDLNRDGFDDLLVGAPMYSSYQKGYSDEGRVYVYLSNGKELQLQTTLYGLNKPDARFGTSLANLGDINHDGYNDIVIGAPYENSYKGAIYIYRGSPTGVHTQFTQRISSSEHLVSLNLHGFGFSFSGEVDVDKNGFNDFLVGSYLSDQAVLLRTRPILSLRASMILNTDMIDLNQTCPYLTEPGETNFLQYSPACLQMKFCFNTEHFEQSYQVILLSSLWLDQVNERCFVVLRDHLTGKPRMVKFITQEFTLRKQNEMICSDPYVVLLKDPIKIDNLIDPIVFSLNYTIYTPGYEESDVFHVPMLDENNNNISTEVHFKMCKSGDQNKCQADLQLRIEVMVDGQDVPLGENSRIQLVEGLNHNVTLQAWIVNFADPAFGTKLVIESSNHLSLINLNHKCQMQKIKAITESTSIFCRMDNPLYSNDMVNLTFNTFNVSTAKQVRLELNTSIINNLHPESTTREHVIFETIKNASISLSVPNRQPITHYRSSIQNTVSFGTSIQINRLQYSSIDLVELDFIYPASHNNQPFVTSAKITNYQQIALTCNKPEDISYGKLNDSLKLIHEIGNSENKTKILNLDCANKYFICRVISCRLGPLDVKTPTVYLKFSAALNLNTIESKFGNQKYDWLIYHSEVIAKISDSEIKPEKDQWVEEIDFQFVPVEAPAQEQMLLWPWIVGIVLGILILILMIILFRSCGFFKRKSIDEMNSENEILNSGQPDL